MKVIQPEEKVPQTRSRHEDPAERRIADKLIPICELLLEETDHDFKHYRTTTLVRRIQHRMGALKLTGVESYIEHLKASHEERRALFQDLLLGMTAFFRDSEAFDLVARVVLPKLFSQDRDSNRVRLWVPGCATGEEAYSLAMLCSEHMASTGSTPGVQIFATDIDEQALEVGRQGVYSSEALDGVSEERVKRFFRPSGGEFQVIEQLRELCLFSNHNLISDPPFLRLDLISCRNVIIYLGPHLQKKLIPVFHHSLRPGGYLLLGSAESLGGHRDLFKTVSAKHRLSQRKQTGADVHESGSGSEQKGANATARPPIQEPPDLAKIAQRIVLHEFAPKHAVVNDDGEVLYLAEGASKYLEPVTGNYRNDVVKMARRGLRAGLRATLAEAARLRRRVTHENVSVETGEGLQRILLTVQPMPELGAETALFLVVFQDLGTSIKIADDAANDDAQALSLINEQLRRELDSTRQDLEQAVQELQRTNEQLKVSNEELLASNEELRSINEELETSKEEVQLSHERLEHLNSDLENLLESTRTATLFLDRQYNIQRFTPEIRRLYNLIPSDVGRPLAHITHRLRDPAPLPSLGQLGEPTRPVKHEIQTDDGSWFLRRVLAYRRQDRTADGLVVTFTDISALRTSEERYRRQLLELETLYRTAPLGLALFDTELRYLRINERLAEINGLPADQHPGRELREIVPEMADQVEPLLRQVLETGEPVLEVEVIGSTPRAPAAQHCFLTSYYALRDSDGDVVAVSAVVQDITLRKRTERQLRLITDAIPNLIAYVDNQQRYQFNNVAYEHWFGVPRERLKGRTVREVIGESYYESAKPHIEAALAGDRVCFEMPAQRPSGSMGTMLVSYVPDIGSQQRVVGFYVVITDVTELKQAEISLREAARHKDEYLAMLAHELRNPLAPLRNAADALNLLAAGQSEITALRDIIDRQVAHMARLLDDLLDVSRIARGKLTLERDKLDLVALVRQTTDDFRGTFEEQGLHLAAALPDTPLWVSADAVRLAQVIGNLLQNALKFTESGGRVGVRVRIDEAGTGALIEIQDTGIGMSRGLVARVFEPFEQGERQLNRSPPGLGLGLALVKGLIELHDGEVQVVSEGVNRGSLFTVRLPLRSRPSGTARSEISTPASRRESTRILVVDDLRDTADTLRLLLEHEGYQVEVAYCGHEALALARRFIPQVVICDIGLPGEMDGYAVARALRQEPRLQGVDLIAVTGYGREQDRGQANNAGFDVHLVKPVSLETISDVLINLGKA
jgi:two-component system CheB/CheR fusion protein